MLDVCRGDHPEASGSLVRGDARNLPFVSGAADLVFCHRLLNHVPDPDERRQMLSELRRVSRQFVLMSCFGPPRILGAIRKIWRRMTGRSGDHMDISLPRFITEAAAVGLILAATTPISARILTGAFLLFRIRAT